MTANNLRKCQLILLNPSVSEIFHKRLISRQPHLASCQGVHLISQTDSLNHWRSSLQEIIEDSIYTAPDQSCTKETEEWKGKNNLSWS